MYLTVLYTRFLSLGWTQQQSIVPQSPSPCKESETALEQDTIVNPRPAPEVPYQQVAQHYYLERRFLL